MASRLLLVRHADLGSRFTGRYVGRTDVPADRRALQDAACLAELVRQRGAVRCVASPLVRARQTADVICRPLGLEVVLDDDLREIDFGRWEGKTFDQLAVEQPESVQRWATAPEVFAFPDGEAVAHFLTRIARATGRLTAVADEVVLAVTHAGVIRGMICYLLGLPANNYLLFDIHYAACTTIDVSDGGHGVLSGLNERYAAQGR